jgi:hypothetical protein
MKRKLDVPAMPTCALSAGIRGAQQTLTETRRAIHGTLRRRALSNDANIVFYSVRRPSS